jgi:DNA-binding CsgD family transcriptional regulator
MRGQAATGTHQARVRCRERIERLALSACDPAGLRRDAVAELRTAIGFDQWHWLCTDPGPVFCTGVDADMDPAYWAVVPRLVLTDTADPFNLKRPTAQGPVPAMALSAATGGDLARSTRWDQCLKPSGLGDEITLAFRDQFGCWGWLVPYREHGGRPFTAADVALLAALAPSLTGIARRACASARPAPGGQAGPSVPGVAVLDADLDLVEWTAAAQGWLSVLSAPVPGAGHRVLQAIAAHFRLGRSGIARLRTTDGTWAAIDGAPLAGGPPGRTALTLRPASPAEVFDITARGHALTERERQLARQVLDGASTRQIATRSGITEYTVKDHLKSMFRKLAVTSRGELATVLTSGRKHP